MQQCSGGVCRGPFIYSPRLLLDKLLPVELGWAYGLNKHVVNRYVSGEGKQEIGRVGLPMTSVQWRRSGAFVRPTALKHFAPIEAFLETQPLIGLQRLAGGAFECSRFDWGLRDRARFKR